MAATYLNNVRVLCKEGYEEKFIAETGQWVNPEGMLDAYWAKTGERSYCFVGLWDSEESLIAARPQMIEHLNKVRDFFEEISPELGVTDPVSGSVVSHHANHKNHKFETIPPTCAVIAQDFQNYLPKQMI